MPRHQASEPPPEGLIQVVMDDRIRRVFEEWLSARGRRLSHLPTAGDVLGTGLPTYTIGVKE